MSEPKRIQRKRTKGWRMPEGAVYVGRGSKWGNPFAVGRVSDWPRWGGPAPYRVETPDGRIWHHETGRKVILGRVAADQHHKKLAAAHAVELFALHIGPMGNFEYDDEELTELRTKLAGRDLACWCPLDSPCHGDVLLELANRSESS